MYATIDQLRARFRTDMLVQLTDEAGAGVIDVEVTTTALTDASSKIDSYLKATYALPVSPAPDVLIGICCDIAVYALYRAAAPDAIKARYDAAIAWLKDVAKGVVKLDVAGLEPSAPTDDVVLTCDTLIAGKRDELRNW